MKNMNFYYKSIAQKNARDLAQVTPDVASRSARLRLDYGSSMARVWKYAAMLRWC